MVPANVADEPPVLCHGAMVRRPPCPGRRASVRRADASLGRHYQGLPCVRRRRQTRRMEPPGWTLFPALGCPTPGGSSATLARKSTNMDADYQAAVLKVLREEGVV